MDPRRTLGRLILLLCAGLPLSAAVWVGDASLPVAADEIRYDPARWSDASPIVGHWQVSGTGFEAATTITAAAGSGLIDLSERIPKAGDAAWILETRLACAAATELRWSLAVTGTVEFFLDDEPILQRVSQDEQALLIDAVAGTLTAGSHSLRLRLSPVAGEARCGLRLSGPAVPTTLAGGQGLTPPVATSTGYRGDGTARWPDARPVTAWDLERGINIAWRTPLIWSKAAPVVVGDRVFVGEEPQTLVCCDLATGRVLWRRESDALEILDPHKRRELAADRTAIEDARRALLALGPSPWERRQRLLDAGLAPELVTERLDAADAALYQAVHEHGKNLHHATGVPLPIVTKCKKPIRRFTGPWSGYAFATPVSDGNRVWVSHATGSVACYDLDGERQWLQVVPRMMSAGSECSSPILIDDLLILQLAVKQEHRQWMRFDQVQLVALDATTGEERWRSDALDYRPNSTPTPLRLLDHVGRPVHCLITGSGTVVRVADGLVLQRRLPDHAGYSDPTRVGDQLVRCRWGARDAWRLRLVAEDRIASELLWSWRDEEVGGGLLPVGDLLVGLQGHQFSRGFLAVDGSTGRRLERRENRDLQNVGALYWYSVWIPTTRAGDHLVVCDRGTASGRFKGQRAHISFWQARRGGRFIAHNEVERNLDAHPVYAGDRMLIRSDRSLLCVAPGGDAGRRYEAVHNARCLLDDLEPRPPSQQTARRIAPLPIDLPPSKDLVPFELGWQRFLKRSRWVAGLSAQHAAGLPAVAAAAAADWPKATWPLPDGTTVTGQELGERSGDLLARWRGRELFDLAQRRSDWGPTGVAVQMLRVGQTRTVEALLPDTGLQAVVNGVAIADGDRLILDPGLYQLAAVIPVAAAGDSRAPALIRFEASEDPARVRAWWRRSIADNRPLLLRVIELAPGSPEASEAGLLLALLQR